MKQRAGQKLGLILVIFSFVFGGLSWTSFLDPDEGVYGSIATEMAGTGDWITPRFNGVPYLYKPPLYFWLTGFTTYLVGSSEWAVRLWSAVPAFGAALLAWRLGGLLYGGSAGLLAAMVMVSSVGVFRYARVAATDFLLVFSITLALYGFARAVLRESASGPWLWVFWLGAALGVLSKGLIGLMLPVLIVGLFFLVDRWRGIGAGRGIREMMVSRASCLGLLLFFVLVLPWHVLAAWENPGFLDFYIVDNQFLRFLNRRRFFEDDIPVGTPAFLLLTLVWFFPWSLFLPASLRQGFPRLSPASSPAERLRWLVGLWAVVVLGFFSLSSSKLEHYFLPAVPALSLMVGAMWSEVLASRCVAGEKRLAGVGWCLGVGGLGCLLVGLVLFFFSDLFTPEVLLAGLAELNVYYRILQEQGVGFPFASVEPFVRLLKGLGAALLIGLPAAYLFYRFRLPRLCFASLLGLAGVIFIGVGQLDILVEPHHSSRSVAAALLARSEAGQAIVHEGSLEYSGGLPFYTGRRIYVVDGQRGDLNFGSRYDEVKDLFLDRDEFLRRWESDERLFLVVRSEVQESVVPSLPADTTFLIGSFGSRRLYTNRPPVHSG